MNAVALFLALVLHSNGTCLAQGDQTATIKNQSYLVQVFQCFWGGSESTPSHSFEVWAPLCRNYVEQPILIKERHLNKGWAMNEFGEFYAATVDIDLMEIYRPNCDGVSPSPKPPNHTSAGLQDSTAVQR